MGGARWWLCLFSAIAARIMSDGFLFPFFVLAPTAHRPPQGSPTYGYITSTPKPGWNMVDVVGFLSDGSVPCKFDTDVNAPALAEYMVSGCVVWYHVVSCADDHQVRPARQKVSEDFGRVQCSSARCSAVVQCSLLLTRPPPPAAKPAQHQFSTFERSYRTIDRMIVQ